MITDHRKLALLVTVVLALYCMASVTVLNLATQVYGVLATANGGTGQNSTATFPSSGTVATTAGVPAAGSCTNQLVSALNNGAIPTCASVSNAMLAAGAYVKGEYHAFCTGAVTSSQNYFDFAGFGSSTTACTGVSAATGGLKIPTAGTIKNLYVNLGTAGKANDKVIMLKNGSATGAPTCTYGTGTTCNDVSTALAVVAGDVITMTVTTGSSDGSANIAVSFELWN